jgi:hypothetical protein
MKKEFTKEAECLKQIIQKEIGIDIMKTSRMRQYVDGRMIYSKILRERGYKLGSIGKTLMKDHSTIIHYLSNVDTYIKTDQELIESYSICLSKFYEIFSSDEQYDVFALQKKVATLTNRLNELNLLDKQLSEKDNMYKRLTSIIKLVNERTPIGKEDLIEKKINAMFNNGKI